MPNHSDEIPDDFSDIIERSCGVFGSDQAGLQMGTSALELHDSPDSDVKPQGAVFDFNCDGCGRTIRLTLEFPEIIAMKFWMSPHVAYQGPARKFCTTPSQWRYLRGQNTWRIQQKCPHGGCEFTLRLALTADEPEKLLRRARREEYLNPGTEQALQQHCQQMRAHLRQTQAQRR